MFVWGADRCSSGCRGRRATRWRSTSSASSGCGRCSIPRACARSTSCTCRSTATSASRWARKTSSTTSRIPAFRVKMDVVPGKLTTLWFRATVPGTYHIFCDQYCGTRHSGMIGEVIAMAPQDYEAWLAGGVADRVAVGRPASSCSRRSGVHHVPQGRRDGPRPVARRRLRQHGAAGGRPHGRGRRQLPARVDHEFAGEDRAGLSSRIMPVVPGHDQRREAACSSSRTSRR